MSRICLNEYTSGFRRAGRLIFGSTFASLWLHPFFNGCRSSYFCYEKRNAREIPLRKEGQSSAIFSRGCPIHLPPVTGHPHALRRHSSFRLSCVPPHHREGSLLVKHGIVWPGAPPVKAPGLLFPCPSPTEPSGSSAPSLSSPSLLSSVPSASCLPAGAEFSALQTPAEQSFI